MTALDLIRRLHQHRAWVNGNLLTAAAQLSEERLRSPFPIGQGSIWKSLLHLYAAEFVWLEALQGNEKTLVQGDLPGKIPGNQEGDGRIMGLDELREKWLALEQRWIGYLESLKTAARSSRLQEKLRIREAVRNPPIRCIASRLHARPIHDGAGGQHVSAGGC